MLFLGCSSTPAPDANDENKPSETFWQLSDDSELNAKLTPWPPVGGKVTLAVGGKVTLEASNGLGDWGNEKPIVETLEYRVVKDAGSRESYTMMERTERQVGEGAEFRTFRLGLFGLDKLRDVPATVARLRQAVDQVL